MEETEASTTNEQSQARDPKREISCRTERDARHTVEFKHWWYAPEDVEEVQRRWDEGQERLRIRQRKEWAESIGGRLCIQLYQKFMEYKKYLEEHRNVPGAELGDPVRYSEHELFKQVLVEVSEYQKARAEKDRKNLERAHLVARCQHTHLDGRRCGAARVRGKKLCRMHLRMEEMQATRVDLGSMEDPDSIQLAIMKLQQALLEGTLDAAQIRGLSYLVQLAAWNVTRTSVGRRSVRSPESPSSPTSPSSETHIAADRRR